MSGIWTAAAIGGSALVGAWSGSNSTDKAADASTASTSAQIAATKAATDQARGDLFNLFPSAEANSQKGYQSALDVFGQFMPQQAQTFQQGNMAAQNQILAGMPQAHNALMGGAVDYSQFQPTQLNYDSNMFQQQLPDYQNSQQALDPLSGMTPDQIQMATATQPIQYPNQPTTPWWAALTQNQQPAPAPATQPATQPVMQGPNLNLTGVNDWMPNKLRAR